MTLVNISPDMLSVSKKLNPECEHIKNDMRNVRIGRLFDAVLIHDAIMYMTNEQVTIKYDRHVLGLFDRQTWLDIMCDVGFKAKIISLEFSEINP